MFDSFLGFNLAAEAQKGFPLEIQNILFCHFGPIRQVPAGKDLRQFGRHMFVVRTDITALPHIEEAHLEEGKPPLAHCLDLFWPGGAIIFFQHMEDGLFGVLNQMVPVDRNSIRGSHIT